MTTSRPPRFYQSKAFQLSLGLLISAFCMWWAIRPILNEPGGVKNMVHAFRTADYRTFPLMLIVLFLFYLLKAWRWRLMLLPVGQFRPYRDLFPPIMIGFSMNNVLPARLGEFIRCFVFSRQQRVPIPVSLTSVALERIFDGMTIVTYLAIGLLFIKGVEPAIEKAAIGFAIMALIAVAGGLAYVLWTVPFLNLLRRILARMKFIPTSFSHKLIGVLESSAQGLGSLKNVRLLAGILVISAVKWALNGSLIWLSLWSFGIVVSPVVAMVLLAVIAFAVAVPAGPGFFGVIQACFLTLPTLAGRKLDGSAVFAASIYFHLSQYIPVTLVGLYYFVRSGVELGQVQSTAEAAAESPLQAASPVSPVEPLSPPPE
ncbi:lysylphosphatidylglycerol synthase transmembrane domain-containing protein [Planctomicrobium sp. SH664]|uniref:lysylphosphatidylglycerol synthase transmembrane domain-containing protein n=1 Tax=Planctomicrobium sp. SH664 TaxID=3448125 RepID=UPI003F5B003A